MAALNVQGVDALDAWQRGVAAVLSGGEVFDLFTTIEQPAVFEERWLAERSPRHHRFDGDNVRDVIQTIFPYDLAWRCGSRADLYSAYLRRHDRAMRYTRNRAKWGTYFERLIRFPGSPDTNQLERVIEKLNCWQRSNRTGLVFHLSNPARDAPRTRGGPCWHFGEVIWHPDDRLDLVAVYRNHDFFNKALGNFIALGQLLNFICMASGKNVGQLSCHSVHAYNGGNAAELRALSA